AGARRPGDAEPYRLACQRKQLLHQMVRGLAVIGALALDQGDGARECGAVAGANTAGEVRWRHAARGHLTPALYVICKADDQAAFALAPARGRAGKCKELLARLDPAA